MIQLRVAVPEPFNLVVRRASQEGPPVTPWELAVRFVVQTERIEILIANHRNYVGPMTVEEDIESQALLDSLMGGVEWRLVGELPTRP